MIVEQFDRRTMAAMELALERVCGCLPQGGTHSSRKRIAQAILRCAKSGNTALDTLIEAGQHAADVAPRSKASPKPDNDTPSGLQSAA